MIDNERAEYLIDGLIEDHPYSKKEYGGPVEYIISLTDMVEYLDRGELGQLPRTELKKLIAERVRRVLPVAA